MRQARIIESAAAAALMVLAALYGGGVCASEKTAASAGRHGFTVEDMLRLENFGEAQITPDGSSLVYVHVPAMQGRPNQGLTVDSGLQVVDLTRKGASRLLFRHDPDTSYWLGGFSPDGRRLLVYSVKGAEAKLSAYDFTSGRLIAFPATPAFHDRQDFSPVWISNEQVVLPALSGGLQPSVVNGRPYMASLLHAAWEKTWKGEQASVAVSDSRIDGGGALPKQGQLLLADANTGAVRVLAEGLFADLRLSADRRHLAALRQFARPQPPADRLFADWTSSRTQLQVFELETGKASIVADDKDIGNASLEWSPTTNELAFFAWDRNAEVQSGVFHTYDATTGTVTDWPHRGLDLVSERERGYIQRPERIAWLGDRLAVPARRLTAGETTPRFSYRGMTGRDNADPGRADWFLLARDGSSHSLSNEFGTVSMQALGSSPRGLFVLADGHVWRIAADGSKTDLTPAVSGKLLPAANDGMERPPYRQTVAFNLEADSTRYMLVDLEQKIPVSTIAGAPADSDFLAASAISSTVVLRHDTDDGIDLVAQRAGQVSRRLQRLNPQLADIALPQWRTIDYTVEGGHALKACLLTPPGYRTGRRYPVIVDIYPGTRASCVHRRRIGYNFDELLAGQGYIVFKVATPSELIRTQEGPIAGMAPLVEAGIDALVAQGYADPDRIGLFGFSQGGISSLWLATQTQRFKAIVSVNGWSDLASHYLGSGYAEMLLPDEYPYALHASRYEGIAGSDFGLGKTLWQDPDLYIRNSPLFKADRVQTPLLLIHSDMDIFPMQQYDAMFSALYRLRKPARYVRYFGEGHSPSSPANVRDMWNRIFDWYGRYLKADADRTANESAAQ